MPGPSAPAAASSAGDAERDERLGRGLERGVRASPARKQPVIADDMQPVPVTVASSSCPFAIARTRSPSETWSTGPVTDATTPSRRAASRASSAALDARADRLDAAHLGLDADERRHLARVAAQHRHVDSSRIRRAVSVRYSVAPAPTGSSTTGIRRAFAAPPASSIASTQCADSVPMLITSADARRDHLLDLLARVRHHGSAPIASVAFAVSFMTT